MHNAPVTLNKPRATRQRNKGVFSLTQVSRQMRNEFHPLYLKNQFEYKYTSTRALERFLRGFSKTVPKDSKTKIVIVLKWSCAVPDFLPIFKAAARRKRLEVSFRCEDQHPTIAEAMNQAIQQKPLWKKTTSRVRQITLDPHDRMQLLVHSTSSPYHARRAIKKEKIASDVWSRLGFTVR
jgi:hypothetical protein